MSESQVEEGQLVNKNEKTWGMACHLATLAGLIIPFGNLIGPLVVWLLKKQEMPFVEDQGKEVLNFQITISIALVISAILTVVAIGFLLLPIVGLISIIFTIIGAIKANEGHSYRYPFALRLIK
ncbi:MAG: DUF4870 domain-containing protein [Verrucomicrobiota bacterium]